MPKSTLTLLAIVVLVICRPGPARAQDSPTSTADSPATVTGSSQMTIDLTTGKIIGQAIVFPHRPPAGGRCRWLKVFYSEKGEIVSISQGVATAGADGRVAIDTPTSEMAAQAANGAVRVQVILICTAPDGSVRVFGSGEWKFEFDSGRLVEKEGT